MADYQPIMQPSSGTVADALRGALVDQRFTHLRAAVAYVMTSGVQEIEGALSSSSLSRQWLTSFDWCRSEPAALDALDASMNSEVRIHEGRAVVSKTNCAPLTSFHPKAFLFVGPEDALLISGSANLSRNGLRRGVEFDSTLYVHAPKSARTTEWQRIDTIRAWFDAEWKSASSLPALSAEYRRQHENRPATATVLDFDDPQPTPASRGFTAEDLARIAQSQSMWIESGIRRPTGHQLMMRPLTRVFFGYESTVRPPKSPIGVVHMRVGGLLVPDRSLEYAHNSMDRINLPGVQPGWPARYKNANLLFRKATDQGRIVFDLSILTTAERNRLRARSKRAGLSFKMTGGSTREFGFI
jgi:HKD family nuclease